MWAKGGSLVKAISFLDREQYPDTVGCSSPCNEPNELSNEEKLQNLLSIAKTEGTNLKQMEYVDVRWKNLRGNGGQRLMMQ